MHFAAVLMDLKITILSKVNIERQIPYDITYMQNLNQKKIRMSLFTKQKQTHRLREGVFGYQGEGINWEFAIDMYQ